MDVLTLLRIGYYCALVDFPKLNSDENGVKILMENENSIMAAVLEGRLGIEYHSLLTKIVFYCIVIPSKTVYHLEI